MVRFIRVWPNLGTEPFKVRNIANATLLHACYYFLQMNLQCLQHYTDSVKEDENDTTVLYAAIDGTVKCDIFAINPTL